MDIAPTYPIYNQGELTHLLSGMNHQVCDMNGNIYHQFEAQFWIRINLPN